MIVLNVLKRIFNSLFIVFIFLSFGIELKKVFLESPKENTAQDNESNTNDWKEKVKSITLLASIVIFVTVIIVIMIKARHLYWLIIIMGVPIYLEWIAGTYQSFVIIGGVVKASASGKLSTKERAAISVLAYALCIFGDLSIFEDFIEKIYDYTNVYLSDMLVALIYILIFYLYIFFSCALFYSLTITLINILKSIYDKLLWKDKIKIIGNYWVSKIDKPMTTKSVLIAAWEIISKWDQSINWIRYLLLPILFVMDIIIMFIVVLVSMINSSIGYIWILVRMVKKTISKLVRWLLNLSDKRIVAISFRIAFIMALICIVILNRYQPIFKEQEASTAILEFLASAIIIPIVFEWINSIRNKKEIIVNSENDGKTTDEK